MINGHGGYKCIDYEDGEGRGRRGWCRVLLLFVLMLIGHPDRLVGAEPSPSDFLEDYRHALARLVEANGDVQAEWRSVLLLRDPPGTRKKEGAIESRYGSRAMKVFRSRGYTKVVASLDRPQFFERIIVWGPETSFFVRRDAENAPFYLELTPVPEAALGSPRDEANRATGGSFTLGPYSLPKMVNADGFVIEKVTRATQSGPRAFKVEFEWNDTNPENRLPHCVGWFIIDQDLLWAVKSYDVRSDAPGTKQASRHVVGYVEYANQTGRPEPKVMEYRDLPPEGTKAEPRVHTIRLDHWAFASTAPREFTLSTYGLGDVAVSPSPNGTIGSPGSAARFWSVLAGALFLAAALVLYRLQRINRVRTRL